MEERRTAIAIFLCIMVVMVYSELFLAPYAKQQVPGQEAAVEAGPQVPGNGTAQLPAPKAVNTADASIRSAGPVAPPQTTTTVQPAPSIQEVREGGIWAIETPLMRVEVSRLGGRILSLKLRGYSQSMSSPELLELVARNEQAVSQPLPLGLVFNGQSDERVEYSLEAGQPVGQAFTVAQGDTLTFVLRGTVAGTEVEKILIFNSGSYIFDFNVRLNQPTRDAAPVFVEWARFIPSVHESARLNPYGFTALGADNKIKHVLTTNLESDEAAVAEETGANEWVAFGDKYFMAAVVPQSKENHCQIGRLSVFSANVRAGDVYFMRLSGNQQGGNFKVYTGPKDDRILSSMGFQLHRSIDLGIFSFLAFPLLWLIRFFEGLLGNYGLAVILLTLLLKTLFLPLTGASFRSAKAMQDLQPEIKALRDRIKDPTQLNQEMAALFKKRGVNPMGGCLPILPQIPVFFGLYSALFYSIELRHQPFALWIKDLSAPEYLPLLGIKIPVLILIMCATMFYQQKQMPPPPDPAQRKIMMMFPLIFGTMFIIFPIPAGLVLYMLVNNVISITQQAYLRSDKKANSFQATLVAAAGIFGLGFVLTLI